MYPHISPNMTTIEPITAINDATKYLRIIMWIVIGTKIGGAITKSHSTVADIQRLPSGSG